jgi:transcriptional regulator
VPPKDQDLDLLHGTLDLLVLKTLAWGPTHGYDVARWIRQVSDETITVEDRALYLALHRLEEQGLLSSEWGVSENGRRARYYALTAAGRRRLQAKSQEWVRYVEAVRKLFATPRSEGVR